MMIARANAARALWTLLTALLALAALCGLAGPTPAEAETFSVSVSAVSDANATVTWSDGGSAVEYDYTLLYLTNADIACPSNLTHSYTHNGGSPSYLRLANHLADQGSGQIISLFNYTLYPTTPYKIIAMWSEDAGNQQGYNIYYACASFTTAATTPPVAGDYTWIKYPLFYWIQDITATGPAAERGIAFGILPAVPAALKNNNALQAQIHVRTKYFTASTDAAPIYQCGGASYEYATAGVDVCDGSTFDSAWFRKEINIQQNIRELSPVDRDNIGTTRQKISGVPEPELGTEQYFTYSIPAISTAMRRNLLAINTEQYGEFAQLRFLPDDNDRIYIWLLRTAAGNDMPTSTLYIEVPDNAQSFQLRGAISNASQSSVSVNTDGFRHIITPNSWAYTPWTGEYPIQREASASTALPAASEDSRVTGALDEIVSTFTGDAGAEPFRPLAWAALAIALGLIGAGGAMFAGRTMGSATRLAALTLFMWITVMVWAILGPTFAGIPYWAALLPFVGVVLITLAIAKARFL